MDSTHITSKGFNVTEYKNMLLNLFMLKGGEKYKKFHEEMEFLIYYFITESTYIVHPDFIQNIKNWRDAQQMSHLVIKYDIQPTIQTDSNSTTVTLNRIAKCFPLIVLDLLKENPHILKTPIDIDLMKQAGFQNFFPGMNTSALFHVIPRNGYYIGLVKALLYYNFLEVSELQRRKRLIKPADLRMWKVVNIGKACSNSGLFLECAKEGLIEKYVGTIPIEDLRSWSDTFDRYFPYHGKIVEVIFGQQNSNE